MPRAGGGTYSVPSGSAAVSGATIESAKYNDLLDDIANELTDSLSRSGKGGMTANLAMGGHNITGLGGAFTLSSNDGGALGSAALSWSDLFLALGAVINFDNGDVTLTHSANDLALAGGTLTLPNTGLHILDTNASHDLIIAPGSNITADRTLTLTTGDASRTVTIGGDGTLAYTDVENQAITGGGEVTSKSLGTVSSGTLTLDMADRPLQHYTNGGAHTLAPGSVNGASVVDITNNGSAGAITTSGWTKVTGSFTTTNGHKFRCHCSVGNAGSLLVAQAMQ